MSIGVAFVSKWDDFAAPLQISPFECRLGLTLQAFEYQNMLLDSCPLIASLKYFCVTSRF